jgi:hypothetical protein
MGPAVSDLIGLALIVGLVISGVYLVHSMTVTQSVTGVRVSALVSIVLMILFMAWISTRG